LGGQNIPLSLLPHNLDKLPTNKKLLLVCHHGTRSIQALKYLEDTDSSLKLYNLTGGLHEWALQIDKTFPKY
jgi:rhodanese-related sulfurtransferase